MRAIISWFRTRLKLTFQNDRAFWLRAYSGLWAVSTLFVLILIIAAPTGLGSWLDAMLFYVFHHAALGLLSAGAAYVLSFLYVPVPRFYAGGFLYTYVLVAVALYQDSLGLFMSLIIAASYSGVGVVIGLLFAVLTSRKINIKVKGLVFLLALCAGILFTQWVIPPSAERHQTTIPEEPFIAPLQADHPAEPGPYDIQFFTYGNGQDRHREVFAEQVTYVSDSADARAYSKRWPKAKRWFWGFGLEDLPLNGRVWMPEAPGKYPLILIVHGNAVMEKFSDGGYGYLGELLASRGFIAVSVDQNFLNYSNWSGIPQHNMKLRAWILLQHVAQIKKFSEELDHPFHERVDLERIAMVGHSRGGQAAAMAADYERFFPEDDLLEMLEDVDIRAVAALAPTDTRVDEKTARLQDTYYLVLQGADDADVSNFYGERHYMRAQFPAGSKRFKASLYIDGANHVYFNTDWGTRDLNEPGGLFLNVENQIKAEEQRQIAMVYLSAFMETALLDNDAYRDLFRDYRGGRAWLPETGYINRYEDGTFQPLTRFAASTDAAEPGRGLLGEAEKLNQVEVTSALDRKRRNKGTSGLVLGWDSEGSYSIQIPERTANESSADPREQFVFVMANLDRDLHPAAGIPQIDITLESRNGEAARVSLSEFKGVSPSMFTRFTHWPWLEQRMKKEAYKDSAEPVFQTYELPLPDFQAVNPSFDTNDISRVTYHFSGGPGKVMIDDLGFTN